MDNTQITNEKLEAARLDVIDKYSKNLNSEIELAQKGAGFFERKYWNKYLFAKYSHQDASNKFHVLLHELSK